MFLEKITSSKDLKKLNITELTELAAEMRQALIGRTMAIGGHLGSNLGVVELTIALHVVFDCPDDKIIFDVSHQSYCHKMLTGRAESYLDETRYKDISGYTDPKESECDLFSMGHTSTSISIACGLAKARDLNDGRENIIAVIGDGSLSGGEAFEGLNLAGDMKSNLIIIVNDNQMSIAENHGGLYKGFEKLRQSKGKEECNIFRSLGLDYRFLENGHDLKALIKTFEEIRDIDHPMVVHICTEKGKGYIPATENKEEWHWHKAVLKEEADVESTSYVEITGKYLMDKITEDPLLTVVTSATPRIFGFEPANRKKAGEKYVDVGIAEESAVSFIAGMAKGGAHPVYCVDSTFIQRSYDQILQDLCLNSIPALIILFDCGIYGINDATHCGVYDISMLSNIPGLRFFAPATKEEYLSMLDWGIDQKDGPVVVRVPGGSVLSRNLIKQEYTQYRILQQGKKVAVFAVGTFLRLGEAVLQRLKKKYDLCATLILPTDIANLDSDTMESLKGNHSIVVTIEDGILSGGFGEKVATYFSNSDVKVLTYGLKKGFYDRYEIMTVLKENRLTAPQIVQDIVGMVFHGT